MTSLPARFLIYYRHLCLLNCPSTYHLTVQPLLIFIRWAVHRYAHTIRASNLSLAIVSSSSHCALSYHFKPTLTSCPPMHSYLLSSMFINGAATHVLQKEFTSFPPFQGVYYLTFHSPFGIPEANKHFAKKPWFGRFNYWYAQNLWTMFREFILYRQTNFCTLLLSFYLHYSAIWFILFGVYYYVGMNSGPFFCVLVVTWSGLYLNNIC